MKRACVKLLILYGTSVLRRIAKIVCVVLFARTRQISRSLIRTVISCASEDAEEYITTKLLLLYLSHIARAQMAQNLARHLFLPFIDSNVRSRQLEAPSPTRSTLYTARVTGIVQRVEESRGWVSMRFTVLWFGARGNTQQSRVE